MAGMKMNFSATEAAKAVNEVLRLDTEDTEALLEVISDYFHPPICQDSDSDSDLDDSDSDHTSPNLAPPVPDTTDREPFPMDGGEL